MNQLDLKRVSPSIFRLLVEIGKLADIKGLSVFLVGGMVRDLILGHPGRDVDIVVEGDGIMFISEFLAQWHDKPLHVSVHKKFGTAAIEFAEGLKLDIVTARRESYARPGSLPDVIPGMIADDLFRRDFTINAVAASLNQSDFGVVHDDFEGCKDIKDKLIRIMHYRSFIDDPTRILRAIRYEKRFAFKFESRTLAVLKQALEDNVFSAITTARYFGEFKRILQEEDPCKVLRRLSSLSGLRFFVYDAATETAFRHFLKKDVTGDARWIGLLAILLSSLDLASAEDLLASFNMPRVEKNMVLKGLL